MSLPPRSHRRRFVYGIATMFVGAVAGLALAETWVRAGHWKPHVQAISPLHLHTVDGVPLWEDPSERSNRTCVEQHPERIRILFFGSSVTFGYSLTPDEAFTSALQVRLNQLRPVPGFCVLNFAQPAFFFEQKYAVARAEVARYKPALIMWEDWLEWFDYTSIGGALYNTTQFVVRPDGFIGIAGVPDSVNRFLFLHSRLYERLTLAFGEHANGPGEQEEVAEFADRRLIQVLRLAESAGAKLVMYLAPPLDRPFAETAAAVPSWQGVLIDFARAHGIPVYPLERELLDQDYLELRLDPCCHFNAAGHRALVPIMERIVLEQLDGAANPPSPPRASAGTGSPYQVGLIQSGSR
jgi:hypothetical protein